MEVTPVGNLMVVSYAVEPGGKPIGHCASDLLVFTSNKMISRRKDVKVFV
jgi:hypothetical protein